MTRRRRFAPVEPPCCLLSHHQSNLLIARELDKIGDQASARVAVGDS